MNDNLFLKLHFISSYSDNLQGFSLLTVKENKANRNASINFNMDMIEKLTHRFAMKSLDNRCCCIMSMDIIMDFPQGKYIQRARDSAIRTRL